MGIWKGMAMGSLKFHLSPPCSTLLFTAGGPPLKRPYSRFRGDPPARQVACSYPLPLWTPCTFMIFFVVLQTLLLTIRLQPNINQDQILSRAFLILNASHYKRWWKNQCFTQICKSPAFQKTR